MKITFLSPPPNISGGQRVIAIYADQLAALGHDVAVVARRPPLQSTRRKVLNFVRGEKSLVSFRETHFDRMKTKLIIPSHSGPITIEDVPDADAIIATWWETAFEVVRLPESKGRKFYFVQHHEIHNHLPSTSLGVVISCL
ncbi:hypothetical protein OIK40_02945 [Erythrobacter sp. sf7]|uniref:Glycosyltransferase subfamily 4-like N-terminal domain-containing protein n=1 Tax=Erythrobacter fulvus TaxID=2987523 RepID=A0ABT5JPU2_9SPHN|nr:hypothetical protein [Erythrobacter fulvus]